VAAPSSPCLSGPCRFRGCIGLARIEITPEAGIYCRNWGAAPHDVARGVHRPLWLTAVAIIAELGGSPLVVIDADLGWWASAAHEQEFRSRILARLRLPAERFLFAVTHTHSAPPLSPPAARWARS